MLALMLENNLTPFVITVENRAKYMDILRNQDIENFVSLVKPLIEEEKKRIIAFKKSQVASSLGSNLYAFKKHFSALV